MMEVADSLAYFRTRFQTLSHSPEVVFFFQAEDGIRDYKVTGVQTCALPISRRRMAIRATPARAASHGSPSFALGQFTAFAMIRAIEVLPIPRAPASRYAWAKIGRASCRERV